MVKKKIELNSLDVKALFKRLGGPSATHGHLCNYGFDISKSAVEKWSARGRIPSDWLITLVTIAKKIGKPFQINSYIEDRLQREERKRTEKKRVARDPANP